MYPTLAGKFHVYLLIAQHGIKRARERIERGCRGARGAVADTAHQALAHNRTDESECECGAPVVQSPEVGGQTANLVLHCVGGRSRFHRSPCCRGPCSLLRRVRAHCSVASTLTNQFSRAIPFGQPAYLLLFHARATGTNARVSPRGRLSIGEPRRNSGPLPSSCK